MSQESPGTSIGPYVVVKRLERQAGEVYQARGPGGELQAQFLLVLCQVLDVDAQIIEAEVERCMRVDHRGITRPIEMLEHGDKRVLVFEGVPGTSLDRLVKQLWSEGERLPLPVVYHIVYSLFEALDAVHELQGSDGKSAPVVHGQLGLHQVMISWSGAITILGFGMSRLYHLAEDDAAKPDNLAPFLAPEQRAGYAATPRGNVYSAAAIAWALLANELPPSDDSKPPSLLAQREGIPSDIAECIAQALEPALTKRSITSGEVAAVFAQHVGGEGQRDLRWIIDIFRGLGEGTLELTSPESPHEGLSPEASGPRAGLPEPAPSAAVDPDPDDPLADIWEGLEGGGVYAFVDDRSRAKRKPARDEPGPGKRIGSITSPGIAPESRPVDRDMPAPGADTVGGEAGGHHTDPGIPAASVPGRAAAALAPVRPAPARMPSAQRSVTPTDPPLEAIDWSSPDPHPRGPPDAAGAVDAPSPEPEEPPTTLKPLPRVAPLPNRIPEDLKPLDDERASDDETPPPPDVLAAATPVADDDDAAAPDDSDEDEEGIYITPSVRPGALAEAPFLTPSNFPPAIGAPPFATPQDYDQAPTGTAELARTGSASDVDRGAKAAGASLSLKWSAFLVVAVLFAFVAGMLVASGPIRLTSFEAPSSTTAHSPEVPSAASVEGGDRPSATHAPPRPSALAAATSSATVRAPGSDDPAIPDDLDGSQLPADRGYLIVRCPERTDLRVYVSGKTVRVGEPVRVLCGLTNVRLGTYPLGTWFGTGRTIPVACRSVTTVTMPVGKPISPGRERTRGRLGPSSRPSGELPATSTPPAVDDAYED